MDTRTAHALVRFGLGRRGDEALPKDPSAWLAHQLEGPDPVLATAGPTTFDGLDAHRKERANPTPQGQVGPIRAIAVADVNAAFATWIGTNFGFRERLVAFWTNHFTISRRRGEINALCGAFVREAIRPHVTGRFADMLAAVMHHPAMLMYLDNFESIGPNSPRGLREHKGINENLARESLELHTVSPAAGYTQADVTSYARILTGWSVELIHDDLGFKFRLDCHEPGPKLLMGQQFPLGAAGGIDAFAWLADHPATHHHLATKLVRHFVADEPPPACVKRIEAVLRDTRGDLKAASLELIRMPEAWQPLTKLRTPTEYVIAVLRALDLPADKVPEFPGILGAVGQPFMAAPLPNGWADTAADWGGGDAILRRIDWAWAMAGRAGALDPDTVAQTSLGDLARPATLEQVRRAGSRRDAMTLLLASPEFNRR